MSRIDICDIPVDVLTMQETVDLIDAAISQKKPIHHVAINAAKVVNARKDKSLKDSIVNCDIISADGQAIVWASHFLNRPLPERVAGIDLMENLVKLAKERNYRIFFLGAKEEVVTKVVNVYVKKYSEDIIAGYMNGYFSKEEEFQIAKKISDTETNILFVAMSSPRKEIFLNSYKNIIKSPFIMGVGGSFDVISGLVKRAPLWMQESGLEWLFRFIQEPRRMWKRYLFGNLEFILLVFREKYRQVLKK